MNFVMRYNKFPKNSVIALILSFISSSALCCFKSDIVFFLLCSFHILTFDLLLSLVSILYSFSFIEQIFWLVNLYFCSFYSIFPVFLIHLFSSCTNILIFILQCIHFPPQAFVIGLFSLLINIIPSVFCPLSSFHFL